MVYHHFLPHCTQQTYHEFNTQQTKQDIVLAILLPHQLVSMLRALVYYTLIFPFVSSTNVP